MKIIRPYGTSRSRKKDEGLRRVLIDNTPERKEHPIPRFAASRDELVIAQWISTIDKIARKPPGKKKPTPAQHELRHKLGNRCWMRLIEGGHLPGAAEEKRKEHLRNLWWFKIHPYPAKPEAPRLKDGKLPGWAEPKGPLYKAFIGDCEPEEIDPNKAAEIAARIERHLYGEEIRLGAHAKPKRKGRIEARAESIEGNVLHMPDAPDARPNQPRWTEQDKAAYTQPGDPAQTIRQKAEALEANKDRMSLPAAAEVLFAHWAKVFRDPQSGRTLGVKEAMETRPGLFAIHSALKECYRRLLKRTRKDTSAQRKANPEERRLSTLLPRDLKGALRLSELQAKNAELAELVRLGKIIHYAASEGRADRTRTIKDHWPDKIAESRFWLSDGQADIKRAEAFVRVWRHALVLAGLTLKDLTGYSGDILGGKGDRNEAIAALRSDATKQKHFDEKLPVLFGHRQVLFSALDCVELASGLIDGAAKLRHAVFHFKGRGQFLGELSTLDQNFPASIQQAAELFWEEDIKDRINRLKDVLTAAHVQKFLTQEQAEQGFQLIADQTVTELPLPRFSRLLERRKNAWEETIRLPEPANLRALEVPARNCQYTLLKLIYERPFRAWLKSHDAEAISLWIDRAVKRATAAAQKLNAADAAGREVIAARAAGLPKPSGKRDIMDFFFDLSAATASEMRVQSGYQSDREQAREQAGYIDDLLCDVVILAFSDYLSGQKLDWLLDLKLDQEPSKLPTCSLDHLQMPEQQPELVAQPWHAALYLILHLLPVDAVGQLLHQLFKWNVAATRETDLPADEDERRKRLEATMTLYLDMHDAKFEGGFALAGCEDFADLFKDKEAFKKFSAQASREEPDRRVPQRGLREIARFGHLPLVKTLCRGKQIDDDTIRCVAAMEAAPEGGESQIALLHKTRERLHAKWVEAKRLDAKDLAEYCDAIAKISEHRRKSNFVNLVDHVRAHRMVLAPLGRLVDYAGLFERDLYFVTLALLKQHGVRPEDFFEVSDDERKNGLEKFYNGEIISALHNCKVDSPHVAEIRKQIELHFTAIWAPRNPIREIRNDLMHLKMLKGAAPAPRLTYWINQARRLMDYDRKLKNAVSKSVIDLLQREGLTLRWTMSTTGGAHDLAGAKLSARSAEHLGSKRLTRKRAGPKDKEELIHERLHGEDYVGMIAVAFEGEPVPTISILDDLSQVDWEASVAVKRPRRDRDQGGPQRPASDREKYRHGSRGRELRH